LAPAGRVEDQRGWNRTEETIMTSVRTTFPARVVVGVDGSKQSEQALRWAAHFAATFGARIDAIAAWMLPTGYGWGGVPMEWSPEQDMEKILTNSVDRVFGAQRPKDMRLIVREGNPAKVLLDESDGALIMVVGSRGHGGFAGLLLGSVSTSTAEHATCPVLVVHGDQAVPAAGQSA
jgi:nucleotide-binding universal stress UspA family protein